jgi:two-component system, chemotaxis family, chemotaxis protein CheY
MTEKTILAIDDSRTIRELLRATLTDGGYAVVTASDGVEGIDRFNDHRFDAVITDINMPNLDGFGVIDGIRKSGSNQRVPILVLTTESSPAFKQRARDLGATGWIVKPFDDQRLLEVVDMVTGRN